MRRLLAVIGLSIAAALAAGCGSQSIDVPSDDPAHEGAQTFLERCSGCHTLTAAASQGSSNRSQRNQGPDFDQRKESYKDVIYAIRNGGFSGAIMPQNIVVGQDAREVALFLAHYAGQNVEEPARPTEPGP
ncbi:MAG: hypothetical protein EXQ70_06650 [Solirubrobacterales bacterium]|nr:hypothetical protein [Solirubrobacterales bacterium]